MITKEQIKKAKGHGISYDALRGRILKGWPMDEAMTRPIGTRKTRADKYKPVSVQRINMGPQRTEDINTSRRIGISYGQLTAYRHMGLSDKEIEKRYGSKPEKTAHRWAKEAK